MDLINKYLTEAGDFKEGKFQVYVMKRTEHGETFDEYMIKASGGALRFTVHELGDLVKVVDKIKKMN